MIPADDLFYRLNVFPIDVPPLCKRKEDIPMLVEYFVKRYAKKAGKQICKIDNKTLELCQSYPWPGNIRELQNIVEGSVILCGGDTFWIEKAWLARMHPPRQETPEGSALPEFSSTNFPEVWISGQRPSVAVERNANLRLSSRSAHNWRVVALLRDASLYQHEPMRFLPVLQSPFLELPVSVSTNAIC
jgi:DNA-binding NtrC family response regulator